MSKVRHVVEHLDKLIGELKPGTTVTQKHVAELARIKEALAMQPDLAARKAAGEFTSPRH